MLLLSFTISFFFTIFCNFTRAVGSFLEFASDGDAVVTLSDFG